MSDNIPYFSESNGLVFCDQPAGAANDAEMLYIDEARNLGAIAVFFRRFYTSGQTSKPSNSEPAVCIFLAKGDLYFGSEKHVDLHAKIWSAGRNEVYVIQSDTRVDVIHARRPAKVDDDGKRCIIDEELMLVSEALDHLDKARSFEYLFGSGTFWDQKEYQSQLNEKYSPHAHLLDHLMSARQLFLTPLKGIESRLEPNTIDKLLVVSILIKFLEGIQSDGDKHTLYKIYKELGVRSFDEALDRGLCLSVLRELGIELNGKIFDRFTSPEKDEIKKANLGFLAKFLRANIDQRTGQWFIWEQYDFNHLPAEVISSIYEYFIQQEAVRQTGDSEKGVIYTPPHLVNFLIEEAMPLRDHSLFQDENFRVLDPACGSGVFLVAAFKRMLQWWTINHSSPGNIQYPDSKTAQRILEKNIFGVDFKDTATFVTIFGLTTALLDKLKPKELWGDFKFGDLSKNINSGDFFSWAVENLEQKMQFDLVIGNPPFNPLKGIGKAEVVSEKHLNLLGWKSKQIPAMNFALKFLVGSLYFGKKVCMIIPSALLLYSKSKPAFQFRKSLFTDNTVEKIYDFTHLREVLFVKKAPSGLENMKKTGRTSVVATLITNVPSTGQPIQHTVIKRIQATEKKIHLEIDYYDQHTVRWDWATDQEKQFVWKTNLLGGGRLFHLIYRLRLLPTLGEFLKLKEKDDWIYANGYKKGGTKVPKEVNYVAFGDKIRAVLENGKYEKSKVGESTNKFDSSPPEALFRPPMLVFRHSFGVHHLPAALIKEYPEKEFLYYNRDFSGIAIPSVPRIKEDDWNELQKIYRLITQDYASLYRMFALVQSSRSMIQKETAIDKADLDALPFPENEEYLVLSDSEKIVQNDVMDYYLHLGKSIGDSGGGKVLHVPVNTSQLKGYGGAFCSILNPIYEKNGKAWQQGAVCQTTEHTICQFGFGKKGGLKFEMVDKFNHTIRTLIDLKISNSKDVYKKIIRIYQHIDGFDCVFFVKPNALRYWLDSVALRDADDTFAQLREAGF